MCESLIAILGWRDEPTDAVLEYCEYLGEALKRKEIRLEFFRVGWHELGWRRALRELAKKIERSPEACFIVQYTALTWSRRAFPWRFLSVIRLLKKRSARCVITFHDPEGYPGSRLVDRLRRKVQVFTMRKALRLAHLAILNVPLENASWVPAGSRNAVFIPVGANLPSPERAWSQENVSRTEAPSVAVFCFSGGHVLRQEVEIIAEAARYAAERIGKLRLVLLGRNSEKGGKELKEELAGAPVEIEAHGLLAAEQVVQVLASCDVMLFVRGALSSRRSSAIAGIACGLPIVAREGWETGWPITEAGVVLLPHRQKPDYGRALVRVLSDKSCALSLAERSKQAYLRYFSWDVIARHYLEALRDRGAWGEKRSD